jgi:hypothetical protein
MQNHPRKRWFRNKRKHTLSITNYYFTTTNTRDDTTTFTKSPHAIFSDMSQCLHNHQDNQIKRDNIDFDMKSQMERKKYAHTHHP